MKKTYFIHVLSCLQRTIERCRRGGKGHRTPGDISWELISKPAISSQKSWGGYRRTAQSLFFTLDPVRVRVGLAPFNCPLAFVIIVSCTHVSGG